MKKILLAYVAAVAAGCLLAGDHLADGFADVPMANRPWCYWWWINGHADTFACHEADGAGKGWAE